MKNDDEIGVADYIAFSTPSGPQTWVEKMYLRAGERQDCPFPLCQLSLGHPSLHCCKPLQRRAHGVYLMVDDSGKILREL